MTLTSTEIAGDLARLRDIAARHQASDALLAVTTANIHGERLPVFSKVPKNLAGVYRLALDAPNLPFLIYQQERLSYGETYGLATRLAGTLIFHYGVAKGDRVGICCRNNPQWCIAYMAITMVGAIVVPMNAWWLNAEILYAIKDSGCNLLFSDQQRIDSLQSVLPNELSLRFIAIGSDSANRFEALISNLREGEAEALLATRDIQPEDDASIMYTSGSTDHPKGVLSTHRAIISAVYSWLFVKQINEILRPEQHESNPEFQPGILANVPLFHVTGSHVQFLASFLYHRKFVMMYKWNPEEALALIERERLSILHGVPTMAWEVMHSPHFEHTDLRSLRTVHSGGAPRPPGHLALMRLKYPATAIPGLGYGLTESNGVGAIITGLFYDSKPHSSGRPVAPLTSIRIVDDQDLPLAIGQVGEICIKGPSLMKEYWKRPEETQQALRGGWLHTGDLGLLDEHGFLVVTGRVKDIIIRGGENIACAEVECALAEHPDVCESVVFGLPDDRFGEVVMATVRVRLNTDINETGLQLFLRERIAHFKVPTRIWLQTEPLERIASGKIARQKIRKACLQTLSICDPGEAATPPLQKI